MKTFNELYTEALDQAQDSSAEATTLIKSAINQGVKKFRSKIRKDYFNEEKTFSTVGDQQYYQMPEDCIRPDNVIITIGGVKYVLDYVDTKEDWYNLNQTVTTSDIPENFWVKGADQFGIYPVPSTSVSSAGLLIYQRKQKEMSVADYTTGTITVTNNSAAVVGSGTTFTALMVGRVLMVEDAGGENRLGYKIAGYTDATHITLEQTYAGPTGGSKTYRIGEAPDIPEEYHESLVDYALFRYYLKRRDRGMVRDMKALFETALEECEADYSSNIVSHYSRARRPSRLGAFTRGADSISGS